MQGIIIFNAFLAVTFAAPGYFEYNNHGKSIFSSISKLINHERSHDLYSPMAHDDETKSIPVVKQINIMGLRTPQIHTSVVSAPVIHAPVLSAPVIHASVVRAPVIHAPVVSVPLVYAPDYSSPIVSYKTPNSAILVKTVPVSSSLPLYASH